MIKEKIIYILKENKNKIKIILIISILLAILLLYFIIYKNNKKVDNTNKEEIIVTEEIEEKQDEIKEEVIEIKEKIGENTEKLVYVDIKGEVKNPGVYCLNSNSRIIDVIKKAGGLTKIADTSVNNLSRKIYDEMVIIIYSKSEIQNFITTKYQEKEYIEESEVIKDVIKNEAVINNEEIDTNTNIINQEKNEEEIKQEQKEEEKHEEIVNEEEKHEEIVNKEEIIENNKINLNKDGITELMRLTGIGESKAKLIIEYREKNNGFKTIEEIMKVSGIGEAAFNKIKDNITV